VTILLALVLAAPIQYPRKEGVVNDYAGILDPASRSKIEQSLRGLQAAKNFVMVLVTVKSLDGQSIEEYGVGLANAWKIGEKGKNNGIVFLIAPHEHKVRIENGYGTEGTLTDIESKPGSPRSFPFLPMKRPGPSSPRRGRSSRSLSGWVRRRPRPR
jgi:uncharacterized protein